MAMYNKYLVMSKENKNIRGHVGKNCSSKLKKNLSGEITFWNSPCSFNSLLEDQ